MKLIFVLVTIVLTFAAAFATSAFLDLEWVKMEFSRKFLVYILMAFELLLGFGIAREIVRSE